MSSIHPDQATAAGLASARKPVERDPETIDGTIVNDPGTRPPLVLGDRDFTIATLVAPSALKKSEDTSEEGEEVAADAVEATAQKGEDEGE